jgi:hypothetical protein
MIGTTLRCAFFVLLFDRLWGRGRARVGRVGRIFDVVSEAPNLPLYNIVS